MLRNIFAVQTKIFAILRAALSELLCSTVKTMSYLQSYKVHTLKEFRDYLSNTMKNVRDWEIASATLHTLEVVF